MAIKLGLCVMALAAGSTVAMADSVGLRWLSIAGGSDAPRVRVGGSVFAAGHLVHEITANGPVGERYRTFCLDLGERVSSTAAMYDLVEVAEAPLPGAPYGQAIDDAVHAVIANAVQKGWIDGRLQADVNQVGYVDKMGAIQAAVWDAITGTVDVFSADTDADLRAYYLELMDPQTFQTGLRVNGMKAAIAAGRQDVLYVVPLPPAAFAGAGVLALGLGVRATRRR